MTRIAFVTIMSTFTAACEYLETNEVYYDNYTSLKDDGEPGNWIPDFMPASSSEIRTKYKIDTGGQLLVFYYENPDDIDVSKSCSFADNQEIDFPSSGFLKATWWPKELTSDKGGPALRTYELYKCDRYSYLALSSGETKLSAFYWRFYLSGGKH